MTDRELRATIRQRFTGLRAEVQQRRTELITETEAQLFARYRVENERVDELQRGLKEITDEANQKAVELLREFEDLAHGGRWKGGRQAMFEVPGIHRSNADRTRLHRALMAEIENQTQQALRVLDRQHTPGRAVEVVADVFFLRVDAAARARRRRAEQRRKVELAAFPVGVFAMA